MWSLTDKTYKKFFLNNINAKMSDSGEEDQKTYSTMCCDKKASVYQNRMNNSLFSWNMQTWSGLMV